MLRLDESSWGEEEFNAVLECLKSDTLTMGLKVEEFEKLFASWLGVPFAVMVNSGSSANLVGASVIKEIDGLNPEKRTVVIPALSWSTTYFPWIQMGYKVRLVDIDLSSFNVSYQSLVENIDDTVCGICLPHILGHDAGIYKIKDFADKKNLWIFEDTCESLGAVNSENLENGKKLGTFGRLGSFSFFRSHHISTMEGGMLVTQNEEEYKVAKSIRAHGWGRNIGQSKVLNNFPRDKWEELFQFYVTGYNLRPLEISGAIGIEQLKKLDSFLFHRRKNAQIFIDLMQNNHNVPIKIQNQTSYGSWMAFALILQAESKINRKQLVSSLEKGGIQTRPLVTGNFAKQPVFNKLLRENQIEIGSKLNNSDEVHEYGFMIANHGRDLSSEISFTWNRILETFL